MTIVNVPFNLTKSDISDIIEYIIYDIGCSYGCDTKKFFGTYKKQLRNYLENNIANENLFINKCKHCIDIKNILMNDLSYKDFKCLESLINPIIVKIESENGKKQQQAKKQKIKEAIEFLICEGYEIKKDKT